MNDGAPRPPSGREPAPGTPVTPGTPATRRTPSTPRTPSAHRTRGTPETAGWIDAAEAADRLGVKPATLYSYVSRGLLARRRHPDGRRSLFDPAEVAALRRRSAGGPDGGGLLLESAITMLGPDRPYYRGRDALRLARTASYESVAEWLWTGADPSSPVSWSVPAEAEAVAAAVAAQSVLPADALPLDRLQLIVTTLGVSDPLRFNLEPAAVRATGRGLIAGMVAALPARSRRRTGRSAGIAGQLWGKLTSAAPDPALVRVLDATLVLLADHELAASTLAARVAASVSADPYAVVSAALGVLGGPMHGGASLGAERLLGQLREPRDVTRVIGERLRRGERIPGFGHSVYRSGDGRAGELFGLIRRAAPQHPRLLLAEAAVDELARRGLPAANVDFAVATLSAVSGMTGGSGEAIFAIARTAGWLAHALEQYTVGKPLRPRATYTGPPPEPAAEPPEG